MPCDYVPSRYILIYLCVHLQYTYFYTHRHTPHTQIRTHTPRAPTHHLNNGNKIEIKIMIICVELAKHHFILIKVKELRHTIHISSSSSIKQKQQQICVSVRALSIFVCSQVCVCVYTVKVCVRLNVFQHHYALHLIKKNLI